MIIEIALGIILVVIILAFLPAIIVASVWLIGIALALAIAVGLFLHPKLPVVLTLLNRLWCVCLLTSLYTPMAISYSNAQQAAKLAGLSVQEHGATQTLHRVRQPDDIRLRESLTKLRDNHKGYLAAVHDPAQQIPDTLENLERLELEVRYLDVLLEDEALFERYAGDDSAVYAELRKRCPFASALDISPGIEQLLEETKP